LFIIYFVFSNYVTKTKLKLIESELKLSAKNSSFTQF